MSHTHLIYMYYGTFVWQLGGNCFEKVSRFWTAGCKNQNWISLLPACLLASVYTSMPDVFQARRNLQSHFSKSRLDCAYWIGLCPLHCQPSRYWCCSVSSAEICAISAKDRKLVGYDDLHLPPPNAAPCKVHSPHIWAEDWPGSGNLRYMGLLIRLQAQVRVPT